MPPLEATGIVEAKLRVASSASNTDFTAKLVGEIPPNTDYPLPNTDYSIGFDLNTGDSIVRLRYRELIDAPKAFQTG